MEEKTGDLVTSASWENVNTLTIKMVNEVLQDAYMYQSS